ncbi:sigma-54 interaction domain-containing protein [Natranaerofaba carboxydovora]|uniref:sigma-54 interaction domain-containing protein n=1 Tax=Natranaerofaba carboxydovora TaxID=2742683 RepID=UPI001F13210F|nr:sigma 54-interacting transcriptional regulator [Natranaerofaba carboxydovora]UMZ74693.1 Limonene hydroxylase [Natranaerofaba carboxydovora]
MQNFLTKEYFNKILNNMADGVVIVDKESKIIFINKAYSEILGVEKSKVLNKKLTNIEPNAKMLDVLKDGGVVKDRVTRIQTLGKEVLVNIFPLYNNKEIEYCVSVFRDITKLVELTNELERVSSLNEYLKSQLEPSSKKLPSSFEDLIGNNPEFLKVLRQASKAAETDMPVNIRGESGTGKGILAKAIHLASNRSNHPFIPINCAAIPTNLLESELLGYEEGAFSGAKTGGKKGKLELANKGSIFLDEIGDMDLTTQAKLLKVIEEQEFIPVGGTKVKRIDIRILSATNSNLEELIREGKFREDLYFRLNVIPLHIPSLKERKSDILVLLKHFLDKFAPDGKNYEFSTKAQEALLNYSWPGNVRELENVIKYALTMCESKTIKPSHLPQKLHHSSSSKTFLPNQHINLKDMLEKYEKELITKALEETDNKSQAIKILGISRRAFYQKLKKYDLYIK